jgi:hypothetical protein
MRASQKLALASSLRTLSQTLSTTLEALADAIFPPGTILPPTVVDHALLDSFLKTTYDAPGHRVRRDVFYDSFCLFCESKAQPAPSKAETLRALPARILQGIGNGNVKFLGNISLTDVSGEAPRVPLTVAGGRLHKRALPAKRRRKTAA